MAEAVKVTQGQVLGAGSLGSQLDQLDSLIGRLGLGDRQNALAVLKMMDQIEGQFNELRAQGAAIKAEESQFEASSAALLKEARRLIAELGGEAALLEERTARKPPNDAWWWYLDDYLSMKRSQAIRKSLKIGLIAVVVLAVLVVVYNRFLAPDPKAVAIFDAVNAGQGLGAQGDYATALKEVQKGLAAAPNDPQLLIMEAVLYTMQGNLQQAANDFTTARTSLANDELFYVVQSQDYLAINQVQRAATCAQEAIQVNPNSYKGYYLLGSAQELEGNTTAAYDSYNKAVQMAEAQGDSTVVVQAKIKMGYMLQGANPYPVGTPGTATP